MKKLIYITFVSFLMFCSFVESTAQQDPMFTQYMFNTLSINPAYAGHANLIEANLIHRSQWVNFDGAPRTQSFTIHAPLRKENIGLGGTILSDKNGPSSQVGIFLDASYKIIMDKSSLAFGLKGGLNLYKAELTALNPVDGTDPIFQSDIVNEPLMNFGFGLFWSAEKWYLSASLPKLLNNELIDENLPTFEMNTERRHFFLGGGFVFDLNNYVKFKPTILAKMVDGAPPSVDVTANFLFYDKFWAGAMYRTGDAVGMIFQYEINKKLRLGYSYDYVISGLSSFSGASHELMIGLDLGKPPKGEKSPRYF